MILTSRVGTNADLFPDVISLYARPGQRVLDMTWGLGVFWKNINQSLYNLIRNDIDPERGDVHQDFRNMDFPNKSFDVVVLDPPYANLSSNKSGFSASIYNNDKNGLKCNAELLALYYRGMIEAYRLLKKGGVLIVKCKDGVESGKQHRNHISIWDYALKLGFVDEDLFDLIQETEPIMRHDHQNHARKNNSFLWVFRKK